MEVIDTSQPDRSCGSSHFFSIDPSLVGRTVAMPQEPHQNHLFIIEDEKGRREYTLDAPVYSIGRDPKCDIRLVSQFVSRRHATLVQLPNEDGSYYYRIVDGNLKGKGSANGLLINGRKFQNHDLKNADQIVFGPQVRAIYYLLRREAIQTVPPDEFDITLISPNMVGEPEDKGHETEDEDGQTIKLA
jgi:pSer/pThr/pTyr-binding forkhead associated (FHA) protein